MFYEKYRTAATPLEAAAFSISCLTFLNLCREAFSHPDELTTSTYYNHVLSIRDTFQNLAIGISFHEIDSFSACRNHIIAHLKNQLELTDKERTCLDILAKKKNFGSPHYKRTEGIQEFKENIPSEELGTIDGNSVEVREQDTACVFHAMPTPDSI